MPSEQREGMGAQSSGGMPGQGKATEAFPGAAAKAAPHLPLPLDLQREEQSTRQDKKVGRPDTRALARVGIALIKHITVESTP